MATRRRAPQRREWVRVVGRAPEFRRIPIKWYCAEKENIEVEVLLHLSNWGIQNDYLLTALRHGAEKVLSSMAAHDPDMARLIVATRNNILAAVRQAELDAAAMAVSANPGISASPSLDAAASAAAIAATPTVQPQAVPPAPPPPVNTTALSPPPPPVPPQETRRQGPSAAAEAALAQFQTPKRS